MSNIAMSQISAAALERADEEAKAAYPNAFASMRLFPGLSFKQGGYTNYSVTLGTLSVRRPGQGEQAKALHVLLSHENVETLIAEDALSKELARYWGALLAAGKWTVPFNLMRACLTKPDEDPGKPPIPETDKFCILGLILPTVEHVKHFAKWYESAGEGFSFEEDLLLPLYMYYEKYRSEYPSVRGLDLGKGSFSIGSTPTEKDKYRRKRTEKQPRTYPACKLFAGELEELDDESPEGEAPDTGRWVQFASGARVWVKGSEEKPLDAETHKAVLDAAEQEDVAAAKQASRSASGRASTNSIASKSSGDPPSIVSTRNGPADAKPAARRGAEESAGRVFGPELPPGFGVEGNESDEEFDEESDHKRKRRSKKHKKKKKKKHRR